MNLDSKKQAKLEAVHNAEMAIAIEQDNKDNRDNEAATVAKEAARRGLLEVVANKDNYKVEAYKQEDDVSNNNVAQEEAEEAPIEEDEAINLYGDVEEDNKGNNLVDDKNAEDRSVLALRYYTRQQARLVV